jgi:hypothetical protein
MQPPTQLEGPMPVWQSALLAQGCRVDIGSEILPLRLEPFGNSLRCTPSFSGSMLPFGVRVLVGHTVTITWDRELSRYVVEALGEQVAA